MSSRSKRLKLHAEILALIERRRRQTGDPELGRDMEQWILRDEWRDLEHDILANPGALEGMLVPLRRSR